MSFLRLTLVSLLFHWRMNLAVALGVAAGTAVFTGALLVGDSMRGSLRHLTLDRLGRIDEVLLAERFFRVELADELAARREFKRHFAEAVPAIILRASLENPADSEKPLRANRVNLFGCDERFWRLGSGGPDRPPGPRQIVLNRPLAERLGVGPGDAIMLRLPRVGTIPAESPLGRKHQTLQSARLTVSQVIAAEGLGHFGLNPTQQLPRNAYVPIRWLQKRLGRPGRTNAILVAGDQCDSTPPAEAEATLQHILRPSLEDYGIEVRRTRRGYFNITSDRMLLEPSVRRAILRALAGHDVQPVLTYLANTIAAGEREIPYSTITAIDLLKRPPLGPLFDSDGNPIRPLRDDQIVLNSWAADDLRAKPGERIRVSYFEPESTHGQIRQRTAEFQLAAIARLSGAADDADLTPSVPGVSDQLTMADWDPPFPFDAGRIRDKDEKYWDEHQATPKAFISWAAGQRLWASRFGGTTSLRLQVVEGMPVEGMTIESLKAKLVLPPVEMGFVFQPVKRQGLAASVGTTSFGGLFLGFSFFIIAAAVMLMALLFRLGIDARAGHVGILLALGLGRRQVGRLFAAEGLFIAAIGSLLGVPLGVGYAALMLLGLQMRFCWLDAVATPFLRLHLTPGSLIIGSVSGLLVALAAILHSVRRIGRATPRQLMAGETAERIAQVVTAPGRAGRIRLAGLVLLPIVAAVLTLLLARIGDEFQAGAFFAAGALVLAASLAALWMQLARGAITRAVTAGRGNLVRLALRNAARNPARSTLSAGLLAAACFLIVAVSAFHLDPRGQSPNLHSGDGGFALVGQSDQPIYQNLNTPEGRAELGFSDDDSRLLDRCTIISLRVKAGDDASCLNLYQPRQPRILGIPDGLIRRGGFDWSTSVEKNSNPWLALKRDFLATDDRTPSVPVVIEKNTAVYSLHIGGKPGAIYKIPDDRIPDSRSRTLRMEVVGLLSGSIFQGDLLISEASLLRHFPEVSGYRFFLIETPPDEADEVAAALERTLGDYGFAAETTGRRLGGFLAVQNTYLSAFGSLGGLGLLLGTFGLAAVELRNVMERRSELALLRAAGFRRRMIAQLVILENAMLLITGFGCGILAALVAVVPHLVSGDASVRWLSLAATLAAIIVVGLLASLAAVRAAVSAPLLATLRRE